MFLIKSVFSALVASFLLLTSGVASADTAKCVSGLGYSKPSDNSKIPEIYRGVLAGMWVDGNCGAITLINLFQNDREGEANYYSGRTGRMTKFNYTLEGSNLIVHFDNSGENQMTFSPTADGKIAVDSKYRNRRSGERYDSTALFGSVSAQ